MNRPPNPDATAREMQARARASVPLQQRLSHPDHSPGQGVQGERGPCIQRIQISLKKKKFFFFLAVPRGLWDPSSPTRDGTWALGSNSVES